MEAICAKFNERQAKTVGVLPFRLDQKKKENGGRLIEISVYLPGPDLCNAFLQPALKLLQFFQ
jgi:hypothetical protein